MASSCQTVLACNDGRLRAGGGIPGDSKGTGRRQADERRWPDGSIDGWVRDAAARRARHERIQAGRLSLDKKARGSKAVNSLSLSLFKDCANMDGASMNCPFCLPGLPREGWRRTFSPVSHSFALPVGFLTRPMQPAFGDVSRDTKRRPHPPAPPHQGLITSRTIYLE